MKPSIGDVVYIVWLNDIYTARIIRKETVPFLSLGTDRERFVVEIIRESYRNAQLTLTGFEGDFHMTKESAKRELFRLRLRGF